jgi:hypothetical protein
MEKLTEQRSEEPNHTRLLDAGDIDIPQLGHGQAVTRRMHDVIQAAADAGEQLPEILLQRRLVTQVAGVPGHAVVCGRVGGAQAGDGVGDA